MLMVLLWSYFLTEVSKALYTLHKINHKHNAAEREKETSDVYFWAISQRCHSEVSHAAKRF